MKFQIKITPRRNILDAQGMTIKNSLSHMGFKEIKEIRQGKLIEVEINENDEKKAIKILEQCSDKLLVNKIS